MPVIWADTNLSSTTIQERCQSYDRQGCCTSKNFWQMQTKQLLVNEVGILTIFRVSTKLKNKNKKRQYVWQKDKLEKRWGAIHESIQLSLFVSKFWKRSRAKPSLVLTDLSGQQCFTLECSLSFTELAACELNEWMGRRDWRQADWVIEVKLFMSRLSGVGRIKGLSEARGFFKRLLGRGHQMIYDLWGGW